MRLWLSVVVAVFTVLAGCSGVFAGGEATTPDSPMTAAPVPEST